MAIADHIKKDSPTNNFATLNSLNLNSSHNNPTQGNLKITGHSGAVYNGGILSSIHADISDSNLYYAEFAMLSSFNSTGYFQLAVATDNYQPINTGAQSKPHVDSNGIGFGASGTNIVSNNTNVFSITTSFSAPDTSGIWQILFKASTGEVWFGKNDTFLNSGSPVASISGDYKNLNFCVEVYTQSDTWVVNFGQDSTFGGNKTSGSAYAPDASGIGDFYYTPPSGAKALCTANLPDFTPTVADDNPEDYFKAVTYTGNGDTNGQTITTGLAADFVWIKNRDAAIAHVIFDSVRGVNKVLQSNSSGAEYTDANTLSDFGSSSFSVASNDNAVNQSSVKYISWNWKAGGAPDLTSSPTKPFAKDNVQYTDTPSNRVTVFGSASNYNITPTSASIGTKQGFGIYKFTASTGNTKLPHGLGKAPEFVIIKCTNLTSTNWVVTLPTLNHDLYLNTTGWRINASSAGTFFQTTADADTITFGLQSTTYSNKPIHNGTTLEYVVYAFTSIDGYSAFGSYIGNASPDGPVVYTGFKPAFLILKAVKNAAGTSITRDWLLYDTARGGPSNPLTAGALQPNTNTVAYGGDYITGIDLLSNGFKFRGTLPNFNGDTETHIFMAFAEQPAKFANAR
jgi:hypothetical protein